MGDDPQATIAALEAEANKIIDSKTSDPFSRGRANGILEVTSALSSSLAAPGGVEEQARRLEEMALNGFIDREAATSAAATLRQLSGRVGVLEGERDLAERYLKLRNEQIAVTRTCVLRDLKDALAGDLGPIRNRVELMEAGFVGFDEAALAPNPPRSRLMPSTKTHWPCIHCGLDAEAHLKVLQAIRDYHFALDSREHGGVAADRALNAIQAALGMPWRQGVEKAARAVLPPVKQEGE